MRDPVGYCIELIAQSCPYEMSPYVYQYKDVFSFNIYCMYTSAAARNPCTAINEVLTSGTILPAEGQIVRQDKADLATSGSQTLS